MCAERYRRFTGSAGALSRVLCLALLGVIGACAQVSAVRLTPAPPIGEGYPERLGVAEPGPREVVIVVNDNTRMVHAGMFAGDRLFDPAGSYAGTRRLDPAWRGVSLGDYLRFQMEDGPVVRVYRVALSPGQFDEVRARIDAAGRTMPLFCAARVQNVISGIGPFESLPNAWLASPAALAGQLDAILGGQGVAGACYWPNGESCYPPPFDEAPAVAGN